MNRFTLVLPVLMLLLCQSMYADITHESKDVCPNDEITLKPNTTGDSYKWSTGETTPTIKVKPSADMSYWVEVTKKGGSTDTDNLISAGDFEFAPNAKISSQQNKMGDWISYEYEHFNATGKNIAQGATTTATDANNVKTAYFAHCSPHKGSWLLVCDGGNSSGTKVWSARNLKLEGGKTYEFRCYASNIDLEYSRHGQTSLAKIQFRIESPEGNKVLTDWEYVGKPEGGDLGQWKEISATYTPSSNLDWAHIYIYNSCTVYEGNDFAIDDIYFGFKTSTEDVVTKEVFPVKYYAKPTVKLDGPKEDCPSTMATLNTTIQGDKTAIEWYKESQLIEGQAGVALSVKTPATVGTKDSYSVKVYNNKICPAAEATAYVSAKACRGDFSWSIDVCENQSVTLTSHSTEADIVSWMWDGTVSGKTLELSNATDKEVHKCLVTYSDGSSLTETVTVNVEEIKNEHYYENVERGKPYSGHGFTVDASETAVKSQIEKSREKEGTKCSQVYLTLNTYTITEQRACYSSEVTFKSTTEGGVLYVWTLGTDVVGVEREIELPAYGGEYKCTVTFSDGSTTVDVVKLITDAHPGSKAETKTYENCAGDGPYQYVLTLGITPSEYQTDPTYFPWNPEYTYTKNGVDMGSLPGPMIENIYFSNNAGVIDNYTLTVKNGLCEETSLFSFKSKECKPEPMFHKEEYCQFEKEEIVLTPETSGLSYLWSDGSTTSSLTIKGDKAGVFEYSCVVKVSEIEGTDQVENFTVTINEKPELGVSVDKRIAKIDVTAGTAPYTFKLDNTTDFTEMVLKDMEDGLHSVLLTDAKGCVATKSFEVYVKPIEPLEPMVFFSPNGDGLNDLWLIKGIDSYPNALIQIFDRFGRMLCQIKGVDFKGWDGNYNGHPMVRDDYWYIILGDGIEKAVSGHFTLKR